MKNQGHAAHYVLNSIVPNGVLIIKTVISAGGFGTRISERYVFKVKISDYIVSFLADKGITDVFGYPGGMVTHLMDSFSKQDTRITAHINYHEQGSAFCACGYGQTTGLPGVAYATSGPGATNLITGIANAYYDSIPCFFLTGQVNTYESKADLSVRQKGFQETDIVCMVQSVTKYAVQVTEPENIRYELEKAFYLCMNGRPGPVLLDIPMNIQRQDVQPDALKPFIPEDPILQNAMDFTEVFTALKTANRPSIVVGAGVKQCGMVRQFRQLVEKLGIPVVSSMLAVDVIPTGSENYYGFIGAYGNRKANFILAKSDLIIAMGSRLDGRQIGSLKENFAPQAKLIRFDVDEKEFSNIIKPDEQQVLADLRLVIPWLYTHSDGCWKDKFVGWVNVCNEIAAKLENMDINVPNSMVKELSTMIPDDVVITTDVGQNQVWIAQSFNIKENQQMLFSGGHGAMGFSLPAAIGACYGSGKNIISISGDGGIQMNIQELQFLSREKLPIKVVILNNSALGMIRHFQEMYFDRNYVQTIANKGYTVPCFGKIAATYDLPYYRIEKAEDYQPPMFQEDGPAIIDIILPQTTYVFPKLAMNKPNQDQEPPISRAIYDYLMKL